MHAETKEKSSSASPAEIEEEIDTLIAISVVAKLLAKKLRCKAEEMKKEEKPSE